jgi:hypothetical protein
MLNPVLFSEPLGFKSVTARIRMLLIAQGGRQGRRQCWGHVRGEHQDLPIIAPHEIGNPIGVSSIE